MSQKLRVLIVEDEEPILQGLIDVFVYHGYDVEAVRDGAEGLQRATSEKFDLIILDVMLPSEDGFSICNKIRQRDRKQAIIMLTAKTSEEDIITGLTVGADDYVAKPFSVRELVLRAEAVLRRSDKVKKLERTMQVAGLIEIDTLDLSGRRLDDPRNELIAFTRREIEILQFLRDHADRPVSREELLEEVWNYDRAAWLETRTVDIHIAKLRRKIEKDPKQPTILVTVRGEGYQLRS